MGSISSISAVNAAFIKTDVAANDIANINTDGFAQSNTVQSELKPSGTQISSIIKSDTYNGAPSNTNLADEAVVLKNSKTEVASNIRVMKIQDEMNQTIIDILA